MDCREFRDRHAPFVDLMCSAFDENEMREHLQRCPDCARHDTSIRRSLMLVRSLPTIEPSAEFRVRLEERLRAEASSPATPVARPARLPMRALMAAAASVAFVTYLAGELLRRPAAPEIALPPVVASLPQSEPSQIAMPAMVAAVPTGMSVWPAIMLASQAQMHFVAAEMASER
jgi:hypothetical protein